MGRGERGVQMRVCGHMEGRGRADWREGAARRERGGSERRDGWVEMYELRSVSARHAIVRPAVGSALGAST